MKYLLLATILMTFACASAPPRGIRDDFKGQNTHKVTLVSAFSSSTFGLETTERDTLTQAIATHTLQWFTGRHVSVVSHIEVERILRNSGSLEDTQYALMGLPLEQAFETRNSLEINFIKTVPQSVLNSAPLLFLEIVYYTEGTCRLRAAGDFVIRHDSMDTTSCIVAHLYAKLIAPKTAEIMWQNHVLLEDSILPSPSTRAAHLRHCVDLLFGGDHGLLPLITPESE